MLKRMILFWAIMLGMLYVAHAQKVGDKFKGEISYYADKFNGRSTASGEKFSNKAYTCAHRTLPFGTKVRVTNTYNGKTVEVKVTDRGPFSKGRVLDLTKQAMKDLGGVEAGLIKGVVEVIALPVEYGGDKPAPASKKTEPTAQQKPKKAPSAPVAVEEVVAPAVIEVFEIEAKSMQLEGGFVVQLGSFNSYENMLANLDKIMGLGKSRVQVVAQKKETIFRVLLGHYPDRAFAEADLPRVRKVNKDAFVVPVDRLL
ncbi:septal ring lytic transglycosylase RlpA family protein [Persicobacter sp. CCB-QB2]|uniref:septal ring lytic transglycosylase RlpA family protein n=1 Tax=Persicobacter sp. CCB-QB2 TaxID=1561025 RepID=UPI00092E6E0A|nr:septal ring lytic transglycosylase RlpA family protein [Persicobacter sp. CCB-QB2]